MNKKSNLLSTITLVLIVLTACSTAAPASVPVTTEETNSSAPSVTTVSNAKVNLNTATDNDFLETIPGLGSRMVREFTEYRPYISIQQFRREIGKYVDDAQVAEYEKYVFVPIAINDSDSQTLQQIPGLSDDESATLISERPFASTDDFLTRLSEYVSAEELEIAKTFLGDHE